MDVQAGKPRRKKEVERKESHRSRKHGTVKQSNRNEKNNNNINNGGAPVSNWRDGNQLSEHNRMKGDDAGRRRCLNKNTHGQRSGLETRGGGWCAEGGGVGGMGGWDVSLDEALAAALRVDLLEAFGLVSLAGVCCGQPMRQGYKKHRATLPGG